MQVPLLFTMRVGYLFILEILGTACARIRWGLDLETRNLDYYPFMEAGASPVIVEDLLTC